MIELIATIGCAPDKYIDTIDSLLFAGISSFRFNTAKMLDPLDVENQLNTLIHIRQKYGSKIKLMLDIPYPFRKIRVLSDQIIKLQSESISYFICKGSVKPNDYNYIEIEDIDLIQHVNVGDTIVYGDGRHAFTVIRIDSADCIQVKVINETTIYKGKSIHIKNCLLPGILEKTYLSKIHLISPDSVALSFVSSSVEIKEACKLLNGIKLYSKIETLEGVNNIGDISKVSSIMLARGDLLLNADYTQFYAYQLSVAQAAKENGKELVVATGILSSMSSSLFPTQSELIDLAELRRLEPDALVLNYGLVSGNLYEAVKIIRSFFYP